MTAEEFDNQFDVLYNNITSNQAPGLNTYEKCVLLTKAQNEIVKNYFTANSKGNNIGQGFDDSAKRQADFSSLMKTESLSGISTLGVLGNSDSYSVSYKKPGTNTLSQFYTDKIDDRSHLYAFPADVFIMINETLSKTVNNSTTRLQVIPLRFDEYTRLMSKPYKRPLKNQAWRLINSGNSDNNQKYVEIITGPGDDSTEFIYRIRYVRRPKPIIIGNLDGLTIEGYEFAGTGVTNPTEGCELDPILHEDILQRAVELAKVAWTATGQDNAQMVLQAGQRSE